MTLKMRMWLREHGVTAARIGDVAGVDHPKLYRWLRGEQEAGPETKTEERQAKIIADTLPNETKAPAEVPAEGPETRQEEGSAYPNRAAASGSSEEKEYILPEKAAAGKGGTRDQICFMKGADYVE